MHCVFNYNNLTVFFHALKMIIIYFTVFRLLTVLLIQKHLQIMLRCLPPVWIFINTQSNQFSSKINELLDQ